MGACGWFPAWTDFLHGGARLFSISQEPDGTIKLCGKLHDAHTQTARDILGALTESTTLDFSELIYISSSGLGLLLKAQKKLEETGHSLTLTGMSRHVRELFAVTQFDKIFDIK